MPIAASTSGQTTASGTRSPIDCDSNSTPSTTAPSAAICTQSDRPPTPGALDRRRGAVVFGEPQPAGEVEHDAGATREREHDEREAHQVRFDLEVVADPAGHAGDELAVGPAGEAGVGRGGRAGERFHVRFLESVRA